MSLIDAATLEEWDKPPTPEAQLWEVRPDMTWERIL